MTVGKVYKDSGYYVYGFFFPIINRLTKLVIYRDRLLRYDNKKDNNVHTTSTGLTVPRPSVVLMVETYTVSRSICERY